MKKKPTTFQHHTTNFLSRTIKGSKDAVIKHGVSSMIALVLSSVIPMLEQWHTDRQYYESVAEAEKRSNNYTDTKTQFDVQLINQNKQSQDAMNNSLWEAISKKR